MRKSLKLVAALIASIIMLACGTVTASASEPGVDVLRGVGYASEDDDDPRRMDIVVPHTDLYDASPILVYIHGGSWRMNDREWGDKAPMLESFVKRGYVVASVDYRLTTQAPWPAQLVDCKEAIRYLRAHAAEYGADPDKIAVFGDSAGGQLAMMLGVTSGDEVSADGEGVSADVQAVISAYGIADLTLWGTLPEDNAEEAELAKTMLLGDDYAREDVLDASPITYVDGDEPPMMLVHAENDTLVSATQSRLMADTLASYADDECVTWYPQEGGHGDASVFYANADAQKRYLDFLDGVWQQASSDDTVEVRRLRNLGSSSHLYSSDINEYTVRDNPDTGWAGEGVAFQALATPSARQDDTMVYRLYDPSTGLHLLSSDTQEYEALVARGWRGEGASFAAPYDGDATVYRLYQPESGEHLYTTDFHEYNTLGRLGWNKEGEAFVAYEYD